MRETVRRTFGFVLIAVIFGSFVVWNLFGDQIPEKAFWEDIPVFARVIVIVAPASGLLLWIWMVIDAISNDRLRFRGWWLFALFLFNWVASIVYFLAIYIRNHRFSEMESNPIVERDARKNGARPSL